MRNGHGKWSVTVRNPWAGIRGLGVFILEGRVAYSFDIQFVFGHRGLEVSRRRGRGSFRAGEERGSSLSDTKYIVSIIDS
jgi:hypothetical protein